MNIISRTTLLIVLTGTLSTANALTFNSIKDHNIHDNNTSPIGSGEFLAPFTSTNYSLYSYIGFNINDFKSQGVLAADVSLDLYGYGSINPLPLTIYALNNNVTDNWAESTITKNNAPGLLPLSNGKLTGVDSNATTLLFDGDISYNRATDINDNINFSGNNFVNFINNDFINDDTDGLITLILLQTPTTSSNHAFSSKDSGANPNPPGTTNADFAPRLNITAVPLPAAVWLFGSGLLGLVSFRRKAS